GLSGTVTDVNVNLTGLTHGYPDDIDMLLVGPEGQNAIFMSDAGGGTPGHGANIVRDDEAASPIPTDDQIVDGSYQPANYELGDPFPAPAPAPSGNVPLSIFDGTNPNGTWSLYIVDDVLFDQGDMTGWRLEISTS